MKTFKCRWSKDGNEFIGNWTVKDRHEFEDDLKKMGGQLIEILEEKDIEATKPKIIQAQAPQKVDIPVKVQEGMPTIKIRKYRVNNNLAATIILDKDESLFFSVERVYLYEPRAIRRNVGVRLRVTKGVSVYTGQGESHSEMRNTDNGILTLTNQRLLYRGKFKNLSISLDKIVQIDPSPMSVMIQKRGKGKEFIFHHH